MEPWASIGFNWIAFFFFNYENDNEASFTARSKEFSKLTCSVAIWG